MDHAGESASGLTGYRAIAAFLADGRAPPARRASDPRASRRAPASLHLVLAAVLEVVHRCADAAGLGAVWEHKVLLRVACARRVLCPVGAVGVLVLASERAHAAHLRAQLHHRRRVRAALVLSPDVALLAVRISAGGPWRHVAAVSRLSLNVDRVLGGLVGHFIADHARVRALLEHEGRVVDALILGRPLGAVVLLVEAQVCAGAARDGARREQVGVLLAEAVARPSAAVHVLVVALCLADTAGDGAVLEHGHHVLLTLAQLAPLLARRVRVAARVRADRAAVRAELLDVVLLALALLCPVAARRVVVRAEAPRVRPEDQGGAQEEVGARHRP
mmetsp:Transcript_32692/g.104158  ORF Transcript_32692/g.104158 Transcript_32692/m.104158 type:complete len:333 (-) Transcript_32692:52-1050(-)